MDPQLLGQPCRNFNILAIAAIVDPQEGREKVVLSNFCAGGTGSLILVDPDTGAGEAIPLPGDEGAWAVLNLDDEALLVGTCPRYGYLHRLDLPSRTWAPPLQVEGESYIWNLCRASDGLVYGGTYPGCALLRYDPARHLLESMGRVSDNPDNLYSRTVYGGVPGRVLVACGMADRHLAAWDLARGGATRFGKPGAQVREIAADWICTDTGGTLDFYDSATLQPLDRDLRARLTPQQEEVVPGTVRSVILRDGRVFAVRGQEFYVARPGDPEPPLRPIPTPRPSTRMLTLTADAQGKVWGSSGFGQTLFSYDPRDGAVWNSQVVCNQGGEVYGMAFSGERLFMAAYSGGDHVVYDPNRAWDQIHNRNPQTLESVMPALNRPHARSVIGPDGAFWTGWTARYGVYGGGLSRVDADTLQVTRWIDPVPGQAIASLAADERYLYFATDGRGNGLPIKSEPFFFVVWDPTGKEVWRRQFAEGIDLGQVAAAGRRIVLQAGDELLVFDPGAMRFERSIPVSGRCPCIVPLAGEYAALFGGSALVRVNLSTGDQTPLANLPGPVSSAVLVGGDLYFGCGTGLYRHPISSW